MVFGNRFAVGGDYSPIPSTENRMLSRSQRLTTRQFATAFAGARVLRHPLLQLRVYRREVREVKAAKNSQQTRAAFVVPKKLGKAVQRNALRRRVRERYRVLRQSGRWQNDLPGCDLIFFATTQCPAATMAEIDEAVKQLMNRAAKYF